MTTLPLGAVRSRLRRLRHRRSRARRRASGGEVLPRPAPAGDDVLRPLAEVEWRHIERVLSATAWNKARAARVLEVDIKTLNKKIRDFKILQPQWPGRSSLGGGGRSSPVTGL